MNETYTAKIKCKRYNEWYIRQKSFTTMEDAQCWLDNWKTDTIEDDLKLSPNGIVIKQILTPVQKRLAMVRKEALHMAR